MANALQQQTRERFHFVSKSCDFAPRDINKSCEIRLQALTFKRVLEREQNSESEGDETPPLLLALLREGPFIGVNGDQWKNGAAAVCAHTRWPQSVRSHSAGSAQTPSSPGSDDKFYL